ncbi:16S rRNA (guanine(527)-N(7))-methyltransferase RsmG [Cardinium endosymbiont of Oedothorax gibbosus]|uniref:16S rRNA (guanine(527)-N(7))-methyltransferase RsmG n=1 Tax=Cardinium endosymbiont of Oedothorax gibbosus TaxID=931101 RepID=UPI002023D28B|nr:16S rRNA (guanine(527)-N(7))-methyltransferase RsmG [Cardinium endosymbiont of Oedothorax gibbosus]CAH2559915.1 Ribosomal RNA small subunit methyltransferase G [Cardinium endosymbiont of Oedothorax gibbosus]
MVQQKNLYAASIVPHYFPELSPAQIALFHRLGPIYAYWNETLNLISRKDIDHLYLHHVLHALAIAKVTTFSAHSKILDFGTGGGFPGIPLAIVFPEVDFHLVDATAKKIKAVQEIITTLGLNNITVSWVRGETLKGAYDFIVGRGVTNLNLFYSWVKDKIAKESKNSLYNGILYLKGAPFETLPLSMDLYPLQQYFTESFFKEKYLVHGYMI